jgi:hypothetical protein
MRTEELEMTKQRYMKKMRAGKLTGEELMILMEINDQLADETSRLSLEALADAKKLNEHTHTLIVSEQTKHKEEIAKCDLIFRTFLDKYGLRAEFEAYWESAGEHNANQH